MRPLAGELDQCCQGGSWQRTWRRCGQPPLCHWRPTPGPGWVRIFSISPTIFAGPGPSPRAPWAGRAPPGLGYPGGDSRCDYTPAALRNFDLHRLPDVRDAGFFDELLHETVRVESEMLVSGNLVALIF